MTEEYKGKLISFLGDSITTLEGYNPDGALVYYDEAMFDETGIREISHTWWGKLLEYLQADVLVNDSFSGSTVSQELWGMMYPSAISPMRLNNLNKHDINPDIIVVNMGTNDYANGVEIDIQENLEETDYSYFKPAYDFMVEKLKEKYPTTEIWLMTLARTKNVSQADQDYPADLTKYDIEDYNEVIRDVSDKYACKLIDIYKNDTRYETIDWFHPNKEGMITIFEALKREI